MTSRFVAASLLLALSGLVAIPAPTQSAPPVVVDSQGNLIHALDPAPPTAPSGAALEVFSRSRQSIGFWVDRRGVRHDGTAPSLDWTTEISTDVGGAPGATVATPPPLASVTIDRMTTSGSSSYTPYREFGMLGRAEVYYLSDGTSWPSGAGSYQYTYAIFDHAEQSGDTIRYYLRLFRLSCG